MAEKNGTKITILGAGNVGASVAFTFAVAGTCSDIVLVDINKAKAKGEAMDIRQGVSFGENVEVFDGGYEDAKDSDIVVVTLGLARKPGQTRLDLAQTNVNIIKEVMPQVAKYAPDAIYVVVSNPVDILTYTILKCTDLKPRQVIGSGTALRQTPTVGYPIARVDTSLVGLPDMVYADRKADFQQRIDQLAHYVTSTDTCRSRMLLEYFGEHNDHDCGQCDVCLAKKKDSAAHADDLSSAIQTITDLLSDGEAHPLADVKTLPIQSPLLEEALKWMTAEEKIIINEMKIKQK